MKAIQTKQLGVALVGLGNYAEAQLAPAITASANCRLAAIVSGSEEKLAAWQAGYRLPDSHCYDYNRFDEIAANPDVDIVYVTLPNSLHAGFVCRAAAAGKHVLCEKPMALTVEDCDQMIEACGKAGVKLAVGYRLHYDPYHRHLMQLARNRTYGPVTRIKAGFGFPIPGAADQWRLVNDLAGGGPVQDLGIYCVQAFCYLHDQLPVAVTATEGNKTDTGVFRDVEQSVQFTLEFPDGCLAEAHTSYADSMNFLEVTATGGHFGLNPAFSFTGISGYESSGPISFAAVNQQALQLDGFAHDILHNRPVLVPGEMGRRDVVIIQAIYEAMRTGKRVELANL